jgi:hypothetical protein
MCAAGVDFPEFAQVVFLAKMQLLSLLFMCGLLHVVLVLDVPGFTNFQPSSVFDQKPDSTFADDIYAQMLISVLDSQTNTVAIYRVQDRHMDECEELERVIREQEQHAYDLMEELEECRDKEAQLTVSHT